MAKKELYKDDRKHWAHKPLKFPSPEVLEEAFNKYFEDIPEEHWTMSSLALIVGSRRLLADYAKREGYEDVVERARLRVANSYEKALRDKAAAGAIFALKQMGWSDRREIEHSGNIKIDKVVVEVVDGKNTES